MLVRKIKAGETLRLTTLGAGGEPLALELHFARRGSVGIEAPQCVAIGKPAESAAGVRFADYQKRRKKGRR